MKNLLLIISGLLCGAILQGCVTAYCPAETVQDQTFYEVGIK